MCFESGFRDLYTRGADRDAGVCDAAEGMVADARGRGECCCTGAFHRGGPLFSTFGVPRWGSQDVIRIPLETREGKGEDGGTKYPRARVSNGIRVRLSLCTQVSALGFG